MYLLDVYIPNYSLKINRPFTYYSDIEIANFCRVEVLFNHQKTLALVFKCQEVNKPLAEIEDEKGFKIAKINTLIDQESYLSAKQIELASWLAKVSISPFIACLNCMLPKSLKIQKGKIEELKDEYLFKIEGKETLTKRQLEILNSLEDPIKASVARKISPSIIKVLIDKGYLLSKMLPRRYEEIGDIKKQSFKTLTDDQKKVYDDFIASDKLVSLLYGVTGSGKTEVYLHLARYYLEQNKEVLIMVPEISLTPQMISRVKERFNDVVFYHSNLSDNQRLLQYNRIKNREAKIVVGTRSSIFLPFNDLGLIIIDEEHDASYKQDNIPLYHCKNVAFKLAMMHRGKVLLASATPNLDSYSRAIKGDYNFLKLEKRINLSLPKVEIIDLNKQVKQRNSYIISHPLKTAIAEVLKKGHQAIILLNRRGYSPVLKCASCGSVVMCSDCDVPLSYHQDEKVLKCHQCGRTYPLTSSCPNCGSHELLYYGFGTKKVEEYLNKAFQDARIVRMDHDSTTKKGSHEAILKAFENHEYDILIGTQMIAKGLDFPLVELVGILNADAGLMHQDYNAAKYTFDLLMQASGRSGRSAIEGKVLIQAFNVDHYVLKAVLNQSYEMFYNIEMNYRRLANYPPYAHIAAIYLSDSSELRLKRSSDLLNELLKDCPYRNYPLSQLAKHNKIMRVRILLLEKDLVKLLNYLRSLTDNYLSHKNVSNIKIDIDPLYLE